MDLIVYLHSDVLTVNLFSCDVQQIDVIYHVCLCLYVDLTMCVYVFKSMTLCVCRCVYVFNSYTLTF